MSLWGQTNLMDPASSIQSEMILFHDHALTILIGIFVLVASIGTKFALNKLSSRFVYEAQTLEIVWTVVPALVLIWLALPSLRLLYLLDEQPGDGITLKSIGHQWYWSYEIPVLNISSYDSYMIQTPDLSQGGFRLLEVDHRPFLPVNTNISVITTSSDVIHAFALPSMGLKMDAVPGRLNSMNMNSFVPGVFYGQCSEICGANHSFMPVSLEMVPVEKFVTS